MSGADENSTKKVIEHLEYKLEEAMTMIAYHAKSHNQYSIEASALREVLQKLKE